MAIYVGQADKGRIEPMPSLAHEVRYPSLMFTETDRRRVHQAIARCEETGEFDTEVLFRLFDQKTYGKSHQASVLLDMLIEASGAEAFSEDAERAYYNTAPRDNAGLIHGYDQKAGAFGAGRIYFSTAELM